MKFISNLLRKAYAKPPYNILTFPVHEGYQTNLARTGHNFYLFQGEGLNTWKEKYRALPNNHTLLDPNKGFNQLPLDVDFDFILSQNKFGNFQIATKLAQLLHLPIVNIEHTLPVPSWPKGQVEHLKTLRGDINLFISEFSRKAWGWGEKEAGIIHHGIDTNVFCPSDDVKKEKYVLAVVNDWINRSWCCNFDGWQRITKDLPVKVLGDTPGLSAPAKDINDLVHNYRQAQVFINTATISPIPTVMLEAMACGCAVVTIDACMCPEIIQHNVNGLISKDEGQLRQYCEELLADPSKCRRLGEAARNTILEKFSLDKFVLKWNKVFDHAAEITYGIS